MKTKGIFKSTNVKEIPNKKQPGQTYMAGDAVFEVDNSYSGRGGERIEKKALVPFNMFGQVALRCLTMPINSQWEISFDLEGREWTGKTDPTLKGMNPVLKCFGLREIIAESGDMNPQQEEEFPS